MGSLRASPPSCGDRDRRQSLESSMSKRARKRRSRKKNGANHGKKPNA
jgi:hypothetical protein